MKHGHRVLMSGLVGVALAMVLAWSAPEGQHSLAVGITIYVDVDATGGNNGSSWTDAYTDLQTALAAAVAEDEIWVAEGTYKPTSGPDRTVSFQLMNGVALYGGFAGTETSRDERNWVLHETILNGDIGTEGNESDNSYHVFYHPSGAGLDSTAILDGFTVTGGNANGAVNPHYNGGGMYNDGSSPALTNCTFDGNSAGDFGGGIYNVDSSPTLVNCTLEGNSAGSGGGMFNLHSSPTLTNCTLEGNSAGSGGGVFNVQSSPKLTNCVLWGDTPDEIFNFPSPPSSPVVTYSDIEGGYSGGGNIDADPQFGDPGDGDFHLGPGSPCIDAGNNAAPHLPTHDFEGDARIMDGDHDGIATVDMGVDEAFGFRLYLPLILRSGSLNHPPDTPSTPIPGDGASDQPTMLTLTWAGGDPDGDAVTYDVKLEAGDDTPDPLVCEDVTSPSCDPGALVTGTHYYWQVVATDEHSATTTGPVWEFTTTMTTCQEGIDNGGFEVDGAWELPVTAYRAAYSTAKTHGGDRSMRVGIVSASVNKYSYSSARQLVSIPADADSATLRFWLYSLSGEVSTSALAVPERPLAPSVEEAALASDVQYVLILNKNNVWIDTVLWQRRDDRAWTHHEVDLMEYAGQTIKLHFGVFNDGLGGATGMYVDDVSLVLCTTPSPNQPPQVPSAPSPSDQATGQPTMLTLTWAGGDPDGDAVTYDVKLEAGDDTPDPLVCEDVTSPSCDPGALVTGTHYYWQVVATDEHSATTTGPVWEFTTTMTTCQEGIDNGGFEVDGAWELPVTAYRAAYSTAEAHGGDRSMRVGIVSASANKYSYSSARQLVTIPADVDSASLRFWLYSLSGEASTRALAVPERPLAPSVEEAALASDVQYVLILNKNGVWIDTVLWQRRDDRAWTHHEVDLLDYAGQTIKLHFGVFNDGLGGATGMYVDDVSLVLCSP